MIELDEVTVDLETLEVEVSRISDFQILIDSQMPGADIGVPGLPGPIGPPGGTGPPGPTGLVKVTHGTDPNVARPASPLVYWVGSVHPTNAVPDDLLLLKE